MIFPKFEDVLPHRDIALMFDEENSEIIGVGKEFYKHILPGKPKETIVIKTTIYNDDKRFEGHFPERKIFPGHWQLEMLCQAAVVLVKCIDPEIDGLPALAYVKTFHLERPIFSNIKPAELNVRVSLNDTLPWLERPSMLAYFFAGVIENAAGKIMSGALFTGVKQKPKKK